MIRLEHINYRVQEREILAGLNLQVSKGKTTVIMGPSGCGKSTLLRLIMGLIRPTSGKIFLNGLPLKDYYAMNGSIGMVFQSSALFDSLSVYENVAFGLKRVKKLSNKEIRARVTRELDRVGLGGDPLLPRKYPSELSGGMRKRVAIARTLAMEPDIILYDEPTTGLDPIMAATINRLIIKLQQELGVTSLVVTHDLTTAREVADEIGLLFRGSLVEIGRVDAVMNSTNPLLRQFINGEPIGPLTNS